MRLQLIGAVTVVALVARADPAEADASTSPPAPKQSSVVASASGEMAVYADTDHITVVTPTATATVGDRLSAWTVRGQYLVDAISAASVDIVSTASQRWQEVRQAGSVQGTYKPGSFGIGASAAISSEPDYLSLAGGANLSWDFFHKSHTFFVGVAHAHDTIGRSGTPFDVYSQALNSETVNAGITLTLNRSTVLSFVDEVGIERGDQSKPYRYVPMFGADVAPTIGKGESIDVVNERRLQVRPLEHLPESRERYSLTARLGYRFGRGTLRIDERLYTDTWNLHASTTEMRAYWDVSRRLMIWPRLRVHVQTPVSFWQRAYVATNGPGGTLEVPRYRTGDRELGPLESFGGGAGATFAIGRDPDPSRLALTFQLDAMSTQFLDDLYVSSRMAGLATLGLQGVFE